MKISLDRDALLTQLQAATRVASSRSAIQALSGVALLASGSGCELRATDTDVSLRVPLEAQVQREGMAVIPARLLLDIVRSLPASTVELELRPVEQDVEIVCANASFHIRTLRSEDFPPFPEPDSSSAVTLPTATFVDTAMKVAGSASRDETRPVLTGIHVAVSDGRLRMVATDSYRLSVKETELGSAVASGVDVNIPARALQELARLAPHAEHAEDQGLSFSVRQNQVVFTLGRIVLSSRLIDGQFPNDRQLIPEAFTHELRIATSELREVVQRVSLLAQKNAPLRLSFSAGELTVSAQTPDVGEAHEAMPVAFQGEPLDIGFNPEYLREGLEAIDGEVVVVKLTTPLRPGVLEAADGSGFVYLIMPIRLNV